MHNKEEDAISVKGIPAELKRDFDIINYHHKISLKDSVIKLISDHVKKHKKKIREIKKALWE